MMSSPRQVDIAVTGRCNLSCAYCFYSDEMISRSDLPTDAWLTFIQELGRLGVMTVCLTGGEVFCRRDIYEVIDAIVANRMRYQLLSNGTLITEETIAQLDRGKRRQRLDAIQISIDGSKADIHNLSRPESFVKSLHGLRMLKQAGIPVTVRVTISRYNVCDLDNIAHLLFEEIGLADFGVNEAFPCGATGRYESGIRLSREQRQIAMTALTRLEKKYPGRISASAGPLALAHQQEDMAQALADGCDAGNCGRLTACGGVFSKLAVLHDGSIVPCHNLSSLHLGRINVNDLGMIWQSHPIMQNLRQRVNIPLQSLDTCKECRYQVRCTGGCPGGALFINHDLNSRNPLDCYRILIGEENHFAIDSQERSL